MDFYEVGVYLVIVIVASTSVFGVMWLLIRSMTPKRRKSKRALALAKAGAGLGTGIGTGAGNRPARKEEKKGKDKKGKDKKSKIKKTGLLELKELPDSKMLLQGNDLPFNNKQENDKQARKKHGDDNKEAEQGIAAAAETGAGAVAASAMGGPTPEAANQEASAQDGGEVALPDLPSMDTLTEEEQEMPKEEIDLMSVFESEDSEDSATSDLAANLFDVDVSNIEKLGSEVSQFLSGMR